MELTERIAKIVARCTDADAHVIAEVIVSELGLKKQTVWNRADGRDGYVYQTEFVPT
jgi:hypothetical protein